jgi:predicted nucleic acid-binding protein
MRICLADTGPLVAYLDRRDPKHNDVAAFIDRFKGQLATTIAVVTEVMYFISDSPQGPVSFAKLLIGSDVRLLGTVAPRQILAAAELMEKYPDTPMDFADATLVLLADEIDVTEILTLDRRGFSTYRTAKGKRFRLVLDAR